MVSFETIIKQIKTKESGTVVIDVVNGREYDETAFSTDVLSLCEYLKSLPEGQIIIRENNSYELLILYFATMFAGKVIIPVDSEKEEAEVNRIREIHKDSRFFDLGEIKAVIDGLTKEEGSLDWSKVDENRLFLITYTSGSTGEPKGVQHTVYNLFLTAYEFGTMMKYDGNTVMGHCMPMTYMAGILNTIFMPYVMNGVVAILPRFAMTNAFGFWANVKKCGINTLWLSPTMLRILNLLDKKGVMKDYFHEANIKISVGTAPLDKQLRDDFESKYDTRIYQSYGLSETLFISTEVLEEKESKHTVGHLLPSVKLVYSQDGEIEIDVPWMFLGYTNADTSAYIRDGRYLSGDLGVVRDGNLLISGRKKELIVRGGYNVNPRDIENFILDKKLATECAVVPVKIQGEEMIGAYLVLQKGDTPGNVNEVIVDGMGKHNKIDFFEFVSSIPKNLNGKVDKPVIAKELEQKYGTKN